MWGVVGGQVLFGKCLEVFRRPDAFQLHTPGGSASYVLTPFEIEEDWEFEGFVIGASQVVDLAFGIRSYISRVSNPSWVGVIDPQDFAVVLATILTFVTGCPVKYPRYKVTLGFREPIEAELFQLALVHPIVKTDNSLTYFDFSPQRQQEVKQETVILIRALFEVPYEKYLKAMQAIRLVHLSVLSKKEDLGLGFLMVVAALEAVSQSAIPVEDIKNDEVGGKSWVKWEEESQTNSSMRKLFGRYSDRMKKDSHLKKRYVKFIFDYSKVEDWVEKVKHPHRHYGGGEDAVRAGFPSVEYYIRKRFYEIYPEDVSAEDLEAIIGNTYDHRSEFVHLGKQPPHAPGGDTRFFHKYMNEEYQEFLLPNYSLMLGIAQLAITNWLLKN